MERDFRNHIHQHYGWAAKYYDRVEFIRRGTRQKVINYSQLNFGEKVLDVCTGTGELALAFATLGAEVTGIDIVGSMLDRAAEKSNGNKPRWLKMDATNLKFPTNHFDIATLSLALHHMPETTQHKVLSEMARVARRKVILVEPHQPFNQKLHRAWGIIANMVDESEYMPQWAQQDFNQTCRKAGLEVEEIAVTTLGIHRITACKPVV
jgi:ubiquinone/menaquinone biosynthesis C-methylase UbiE